jgi:hypothetical protein
MYIVRAEKLLDSGEEISPLQRILETERYLCLSILNYQMKKLNLL